MKANELFNEFYALGLGYTTSVTCAKKTIQHAIDALENIQEESSNCITIVENAIEEQENLLNELDKL